MAPATVSAEEMDRCAVMIAVEIVVGIAAMIAVVRIKKFDKKPEKNEKKKLLISNCAHFIQCLREITE